MMPRNRIHVLALVLTGLTIALGGCASSREADDHYATNRALEERNLMMQQEVQAKENTIALLRSRVREADETVGQVRDRNGTLQSELRRLEERYRGLSGRLDRVSLGAIDPATENALANLAAANPTLFSFDSQRGMLRFNSDVTFAPGSDQVSAAASAALTQIAGVLAQSSSDYDLRIVGHTDNVKPSRPETLRNHPTNTHLSAHRAISVRNVLASAGISAGRMEVAGWGELRPVVPNRAGQGTAANRRVEIFLVPSSSAAPSDPAPAPTTKPAAPAATAEPFK